MMETLGGGLHARVYVCAPRAVCACACFVSDGKDCTAMATRCAGRTVVDMRSSSWFGAGGGAGGGRRGELAASRTPCIHRCVRGRTTVYLRIVVLGWVGGRLASGQGASSGNARPGGRVGATCVRTCGRAPWCCCLRCTHKLLTLPGCDGFRPAAMMTITARDRLPCNLVPACPSLARSLFGCTTACLARPSAAGSLHARQAQGRKNRDE